MSKSTTPSTVEVTTELGEAIVQREHGQRTGEGHAAHSWDAAQREAESSKAQDSDAAFHDAFLEAINASKPLRTDKERQEQEDRERERQEAEQAEQAEEAGQEEAEAEEEAEEESGPNPLDAFAPEAVAKLAEQFGLTEEDLELPAVQRMLAARMSDQTEITNKVEVPVQQAQQDEQRLREHLEGLSRLAQNPEINSPEMTRIFEASLAQCFGAESPEALQNVKNLSSVLTQGGLNLMSSVVPRILAHYLPSYVEQLLPGLAESHRDATYHNVWADVRSSDPSYRELPNLKTPEFDELYQKVITENPWVQTIEYKDGNGRTLHPDHPQAVRQAANLFARLASGQKLSPEAVKAAVEKGRKEATSHSRRVAASRSLGAGKSSGQAFRPTSSSNEFRDAILQYNKSQRNTEEEY